MTLQRQLLLISLSIFILPWAGCQFVKEMDNTLRNGQISSLTAQARAIAITLQNSQASSGLFPEPTHESFDIDQQIYFPLLASRPIIDGYNSDWATTPIKPRLFKESSITGTSNPLFFELTTGIHSGYAYLLFSISDNTKQFHNPQKLGIANGDHIIFHTKDKFLRNKNYVLRNSGSGEFIAYHTNSAGTIKPESSIKGFWRETFNGYTVEVQLPLSFLNDYLSIAYVDNNDPKRIIPKLKPTSAPKPIPNALASKENIYPEKIIRYTKELANIINPYTEAGMSITVVNSNQWVLAKTHKEKETIIQEDDTFWVMKWLYKTILNKKSLPALSTDNNDGRIISLNIKKSLEGDQTSHWYQQESDFIARVTAPIYNNTSSTKNIMGVVILEQSASAVSAATNSAFNRLFIITLSAMAFVTVTLLAYASLLSFRIRRLRNATDTAIGSDGKINPQFLTSSAKDEVGDLTRSYKQLLERLNDYTEYLRTLASKLSHELRTPLAVIKSSLDNLDQNLLTKDDTSINNTHQNEDDNKELNSQYIRRASEGAERLSNILNAMSAANRIEESIHDTQVVDFELDQLLNELIAAYQSTYPNKRIELTINTVAHHKKAQGSPFSINGSPDLIVQMLDKLIDNAVDFCPDQGVISFTLELLKSSNTLLLQVSNTGPLLPSHMRGQLFDSLVSLRDEKTYGHQPSKTHLGLGLHIVRLIADFHSANVTADNLPDESGVIFSIELPKGKPL